MKQRKLRWAVALLAAFGLTQHVRADSITNNFNTGVDYIAAGVPGTMWDGVYLGNGDVFGGDTGNLAASTTEANETADPGFLSLIDSANQWSGTVDNGFYLWKVVSGDFDVSVQCAPPMQNTPDHFMGLMVRAYSVSPHFGSPYKGENWMDMMRFDEFAIDEDIRYATNGADNDGYVLVPETITNLTAGRYVRITRTGDVFTFYDKTNQTDAWIQEGTLTRTDLDGLPMQVGIADATFGATGVASFFTDFELTGTNVVAAVTPPANPTGLTATANLNSVTFNWTPGSGSAGSILLLRKNDPNIVNEKPVNSYTYNGVTNFAGGDDIGGGIYAVYVGSGSTATVTGLGSTNQNYSAAVYSFSGSGSSTVYGTTPATNSTTGPGIPQGLNFTVSPTNGIPVQGVAIPSVLIFDNIGDTDVVAGTTATWTSGDTTKIVIGADGTISGIGVGTVQVAVSFDGFNATNTITVRTPAYTDNFFTPHDYLTNGLPGSTWDGIYYAGTNIPSATFGPPAAGISEFNANMYSNNALAIRSVNSQWKNAQDNGPFLFKNVPGDFQVSVHITNYSIVNYDFTGLMARAYALSNNASGNGPGASENTFQWMRFDEFGLSTGVFNTSNGGTAESEESDGETTDYWLLMTRMNGTNINVYKKANPGDPWISVPAETAIRNDWTNGVPLQVGLMQAMFTGNNGTVAFDNFMLDAANISGTTAPPSPTTGLTIVMNGLTQATLTWVPGTNSDGSQQTSFVVMRANGPVTAQPYFGILTSASSIFGQGTDLGGGNFLVFRAVGNTVTVTGLQPGTVYYVSVYGYAGSGGTKTFNESGSSVGSTPPVAFTGLIASLPTGDIPVGGVGLLKVLGQIQGAGTFDVSRSAQITPGNPSVMVGTNGFLTGLAPGTATNILTVVNGTNIVSTTLVSTVRPASFTDNFSTPHDYIANGITNTTWDGVYAQPGVNPGSTFVPVAGAAILDADADTTSNGVLNVTSENVGWENAENDGFYLFKNVTGDFQASVHITYLNTNGYEGSNMVAYNNPGILARLTSTNGAPFNPTNGFEDWISFTRFDLFGDGTYARRELNNAVNQQPVTGTGFNGGATASDTNLWLLVVRENLTNFMFFQRQNPTDPWKMDPNGTTFSPSAFTNKNLQVGLMACGFDSGNIVQSGFDTFTLDTTPAPTLSASGAGGGNVNVNWVPEGSFTLQFSPSLIAPNWQPVGIAPVYSGGAQVGVPVGAGSVLSGGMNTVTVPATNSETFFRLVQ